MSKILLYNGLIVTPQSSFEGFVEITGDRISKVEKGYPSQSLIAECDNSEDLKGKWILPGVIDDQVHFRDPGLTHKGDIGSESKAAVAGGVTSFMDMPNTVPQTVSLHDWEDKMAIASDKSWANYAFYFGVTNNNFDEIEKLDSHQIPGLKVFLGSSTGNMLVDKDEVLDRIFSLPLLIAIHSEDETIIKANRDEFYQRYGENVPISAHPLIRSSKACAESTRKAIERAKRLNTRLHILHLSTAEECKMLDNGPLKTRKITAEACVHHLWFSDADYERLGTRIKWNPAIKQASDRDELRKAITDGRLQIVATDHAPHLLTEKEGGALKAASGGPSIQYSLLIMLELALNGVLTKEQVVELMCKNPATLFHIRDRGELTPGFKADIVIIDPQKATSAGKVIYSKCGWSPYEGIRFSHSVDTTYVNGVIAYQRGKFGIRNPEPLSFT